MTHSQTRMISLAGLALTGGIMSTSYGLVAIAGGVLFTLAVAGYLAEHARTVRAEIGAARETRCRKCGYILRGITEPRCPECGERI